MKSKVGVVGFRPWYLKILKRGWILSDEEMVNWVTGMQTFWLNLNRRKKGDVVLVEETMEHGSCCPKMQNRIVDYTIHGNHKTKEINDALKRKCTLWVRFKPAEDEEEAKNMEDELLSRYNYAWNVRNNGVRPILAMAINWV